VQHLFQRKNQSTIEIRSFDFYRTSGTIAPKRFPKCLSPAAPRAKNGKGW